MPRNTTITVDHNGKSYTAEAMTIKSTMLGYEDHGILTCYLHCEAQGSGISVGGYGLDEWSEADTRRIATGYGLDQIVQILRVAGVERWEALLGRPVLVLYEGRGSVLGKQSKGIASLTTDDVLVLDDHAAEWKERVAP